MKCILLALLISLLPATVNAETPQAQTILFKMANGNEHQFSVELADDDQKREQGLMNRTSLEKNSGMLFVFPEEGVRGFWMKNTYIPLDMIFMSADGTIVKIHENAKPHDLTPIFCLKPALAVLEINGGMARAVGLKAGDKAFHTIFSNGLASEKTIQ